MEPSEIEEEGQTKTNSWWQNLIEKIKYFPPLINSIVGFATVVIAAYAILQYCSFKKFTKKNNRAYLVVVEPILGWHIFNKDSIPKITYFVKNTGQTPAYSATDSIIFENRWRSCGPLIPISTDTSSKWLYGPGETKREIFFNQISRVQKCNIIQDDTIRTFFSGRIKYFDIFKESHEITFCFEMQHFHGKKFFPYGSCNDGN